MIVEKTQFSEIYQRRVARLAESSVPAPQKRWRIWLEQERTHELPCFVTASRDTCVNHECELRKDCIALRAEWRR